MGKYTLTARINPTNQNKTADFTFSRNFCFLFPISRGERPFCPPCGRPWVLCLSRNPRQCMLQVSGSTLQQVETFKYLGVVFKSDGRRNKEIDTRIGKANAVPRELYLRKAPNVETLLRRERSTLRYLGTWPKCLRKDWWSRSCWIHPRGSGRRVDKDHAV